MTRTRLVVPLALAATFGSAVLIYLNRSGNEGLPEATEQNPVLKDTQEAHQQPEDRPLLVSVKDKAGQKDRPAPGPDEYDNDEEEQGDPNGPTPYESLLLQVAPEIIRWQNERGYTFADEDTGEAVETDYDTYSDDTLEELANNGDRRAALLLGTRLMSNEATFGRAATHFFDASVRGYTATLIAIGSLNEAQLLRSRARGNLELAREHAINAKAWYKVAILRGDPLGHNVVNGMDYEFSSEDMSAADTLSERIYSDLKARRDELRLPEFENEYPAALDLLMNPP